MDFTSFLSASEERRARLTLESLCRAPSSRWILTGGLAIGLHMARHGCAPELRPLNDIDFLVERFDEIPRSLPPAMLFRHVHPHDPPGRTLLQCVHSETEVRIDIFRANGHTTARAVRAALYGFSILVVSIEDLVARSARLSMDLALGQEVPEKHALDLLRLLPLVAPSAMEPIWQEHRKASHPSSFAEAAALLKNLIETRSELLTTPKYDQNLLARCSRCQNIESFPLTDALRIQALLGYC